MISKWFKFQCDFDFDFQITTSKMIWILILNHLYLGDLILKSSTYDVLPISDKKALREQKPSPEKLMLISCFFKKLC